MFEFAQILSEYQGLISVLLTGLFTLAGAAIGAFLTRSKEKRATRRREIADCYASFLQAYTEYIAERNQKTKGHLLYTLEIARLLCPGPSAELFKNFENRFLHDPSNFASRNELLDQIRKQGVKDLSKL